jgi:hypothetical protein
VAALLAILATLNLFFQVWIEAFKFLSTPQGQLYVADCRANNELVRELIRGVEARIKLLAEHVKLTADWMIKFNLTHEAEDKPNAIEALFNIKAKSTEEK